MKKYFSMLLMFCSVLSFTLDSGYAAEVILQPSQVSKLFLDKTMTITSGRVEKKTGKHRVFKAYASDMGGLRVVYQGGATETRSWSVTEKGDLCISRSTMSRAAGATCGVLVSDGSGVYRMYPAKGLVVRGDRIAGTSQSKLLLTFSNFQQGNKL